METFNLVGSIMAFLAPAAFVMALGALSYVGKLKKEVDQAKAELNRLADKLDQD